MQMPNVLHPNKFSINGIFFEVVSYDQLTDDQARKVVLFFCQTYKFLKKNIGITVTITTMHTQASVGLL